MALARFVPCSVYVTVNHESIRRVAWSSSLTGGNRLLVRSLMQVAKKSVIPKMASLRALLPSVRCSGRVVQCTTRRARIQQQQRRLATEAVQNVARRSGVSVPTVSQISLGESFVIKFAACLLQRALWLAFT